MISKDMLNKMQEPGGIREAFNEARRQYEVYGKENVFDLSIGNPCLPSPAKVRDVIIDLLDNQNFQHGYMNNAGYEDVREKIADSLNKNYQESYSKDQIIMTTGAAGGLNIILCALLDPSDEVIVFRPYYPSYANFIENWGGKMVTVKAEGANFWPDYKDFENKITSKTKVVLVNSPHNPTGTIYSKEVAETIAGILRKKQEEYQHAIYLLSDEPYRELVYDGTDLPWWPHEYDNSIVVYSFSKSLSLAGERIGYLLIPPKVEDYKLVNRAVCLAMGKIGYVNAPAMFQKVVAECMDERIDVGYYARNRALLYGTLQKYHFEAVYPRGAFYIFVKSPMGEEEFLEMARRRHLIFVGGSSFAYEGYVRLSFCCDYEVLKRAVPAFELLAKDCNLI